MQEMLRRSVVDTDALCHVSCCAVPTTLPPPHTHARAQVCCGSFGCCPTKRCINNATTGNQPYCCGDDCNIGQNLNCCPGGNICVNTSGSAVSCIEQSCVGRGPRVLAR
jgi:hypothetical protein